MSLCLLYARGLYARFSRGHLGPVSIETADPSCFETLYAFD